MKSNYCYWKINLHVVYLEDVIVLNFIPHLKEFLWMINMIFFYFLFFMYWVCYKKKISLAYICFSCCVFLVVLWITITILPKWKYVNRGTETSKKKGHAFWGFMYYISFNYALRIFKKIISYIHNYRMCNLLENSWNVPKHLK